MDCIFFRNFKYQKGRVNESKFHFGHEFAALGTALPDGDTLGLVPCLGETHRAKENSATKAMLS